VASAQEKTAPKSERPSLQLRLTPRTGMVPIRIVGAAELRGGSDDFEDFYCVTVEWDWDDGTRSEQTADCDPYQSGKSEIRRRYTVEHTYDRAGSYRVTFRLKKKDKAVAASTATVQVIGGDLNRY
jgi:PKD domain